MSAIKAIKTDTAERRTATDIAHELGAIFEQRASDTSDHISTRTAREISHLSRAGRLDGSGTAPEHSAASTW